MFSKKWTNLARNARSISLLPNETRRSHRNPRKIPPRCVSCARCLRTLHEDRHLAMGNAAPKAARAAPPAESLESVKGMYTQNSYKITLSPSPPLTRTTHHNAPRTPTDGPHTPHTHPTHTPRAPHARPWIRPTHAPRTPHTRPHPHMRPHTPAPSPPTPTHRRAHQGSKSRCSPARGAWACTLGRPGPTRAWT